MVLIPYGHLTGTGSYSPEDIVNDDQGGLGLALITRDVDFIESGACLNVGTLGGVVRLNRRNRAAGLAVDGSHSVKRVEMAKDS